MTSVVYNEQSVYVILLLDEVGQGLFCLKGWTTSRVKHDFVDREFIVLLKHLSELIDLEATVSLVPGLFVNSPVALLTSSETSRSSSDLSQYSRRTAVLSYLTALLVTPIRLSHSI